MSIGALTNTIAAGQPADINRDTLAEQTKQAIDGLFGARYQARSRCSVRVALMPGAYAVSFAGSQDWFTGIAPRAGSTVGCR